jgi:GH24 family phage-related lysozyme (muramidase)
MIYRELHRDAYLAQALQWLVDREGRRFAPYIDSEGWITVGIGINLGQTGNVLNRNRLYDYLEITIQRGNAAFDALDNFLTQNQGALRTQANNGIAGGGDLGETLITDGLRTQLDALAHAAGMPANRTFGFYTQAGAVFTDDVNGELTEAQFAVAANDVRLTDRLAGAVGGVAVVVPDSEERVALLSLFYNAATLIGPNLKRALNTGNRAEAWFQIRYLSNALTS